VRILTTASRLDGIGGLERAQLEACRQLRARGHRIDLLYIEPGDLSREWEEVAERRVHVGGYSLFRGAPLGSRRRSRASWRPRAGSPPTLYTFIITTRPWLRRALICHMHLPPPPSRSLQDDFALRRSRGLFAVSRFNAAQWSESLGVPIDRFAIVTNGVNLDRFSPADASRREAVRAEFELSNDRFLILCAGRVDPDKGIEVALETLGLLDPAEYHLAVAGEPNPASFGGDPASRTCVRRGPASSACRRRGHLAGMAEGRLGTARGR